MRLRYAGTCTRCGASLPAGTTADYDRASRTVACVTCSSRVNSEEPNDPAPAQGTVEPSPASAVGADPLSPGLAAAPLPSLGLVDGQGGASAAAEFQRRHDARQERVLNNHPRIGRFLLAAFDDPSSTRAWSVGGEGERMLGEMLGAMANESLRVLHDRRIPRSTANIDHLVVCPSGVFVVEAKRYRNARPELRVEGDSSGPASRASTSGDATAPPWSPGCTSKLASFAWPLLTGPRSRCAGSCASLTLTGP